MSIGWGRERVEVANQAYVGERSGAYYESRESSILIYVMSLPVTFITFLLHLEMLS